MRDGRHLRRFVAAVAVLGAVVGCSGERSGPASASATSPPRVDAPDPSSAAADHVGDGRSFPDDWTPPPLEWTSCDVVPLAECATLEVPLDWQDPDGPTIELAIGRSRASGARIGSLLTNPGGPGGSGLEFLSWSPFEAPIDERFDVVSWDPRGVGASTPLQCDDNVDAFFAMDPDPDTPAERAELERAADAVARDCERAHGDLLAHLDTVAVAFDMEAIRRALGDEPLNYVGFSYGTQIGQEYAERFPDRIRAMVLDGVVDPAMGFEEFLLGQTAAFDATFDEAAAACSRRAADCGVDDLAVSYDRVAAAVDQRPLQAPGGPVGPAELATAALLTGYLVDGWRQLGPALAAAEQGDGAALRALADSYYDLAGYAAYAAVVCTDSAPPRGADAFAEFADRARSVSARFGGAIANEMLPCATWGAPPVGTPRPIQAPGAPPLLVVGNTGDPATPFENARTVAASLESGVLVTVEMDGHTAYGTSGCLTRLVDEYLTSLSLPGEHARCT